MSEGINEAPVLPPEPGVTKREIEDELKESFLDYAMSVIVARALPDVRDGLKPVHRRILYSMLGLGVFHNKPPKKCARIVGDCMGKYHPHGNTAIYDSLVRMAQEWSLRYPLVQGQGNFGSIDGDPAAADRYTEARLAKIAEDILEDIKKDTVNFVPNYNDELKEPTVLPSRIPNLLINGSSGIAVGMATNIPPHNLSEVCDGIIQLVDNPEIEVKELMNYIKGPDFPTYGFICGKNGIVRSYLSGRGRVVMKARHNLEHGKSEKDKESIIFTEIPYQVNKSQLIEEVANLVKSGRIEDISDLRDESSKEGMRIVVVLKKGANSDVVLNQLYKYSRLKTTFGCNMVVLVNGEPKTLNLRGLLSEFVKHRKEVIERRTQYDLAQAKEREHKLEGLNIALDNIDDVVELIKSSKSGEEASKSLMVKYSLSEIQSKTILEMRLQRLTGLEQDKIREELKEIKHLILELETILSDEKNIFDIVKKETLEVKEKYGDERRTQFLEEEEEIVIEDLIEEQTMVVTLTRDGYVKRVPLSIYKTQNRGGRGVLGTKTKEEDFVNDVFVASTHDTLLCFTRKGIVHWLKVYNLPEGSRQGRGKAIVNLLKLKNDSVSALVPLSEFETERFLMFVTERGFVKKTKLMAYSKPRKGGIIAITLEESDSLANVFCTDGAQEVLLATADGNAIRFSESDVRPSGRAARGVRGINLRTEDRVVSAVYLDRELDILTVTKRGYGKRTPSRDYNTIRRAGKGVINIKTTERNGKVVSVQGVLPSEGVMLISKKGIIIRMGVKNISRIGRNTQGVRLMNLGSDDETVAATKIMDDGEELSEGGEKMEEFHEDQDENTEDNLTQEVEDDEIDAEEEGVVRGYMADADASMEGEEDEDPSEADEKAEASETNTDEEDEDDEKSRDEEEVEKMLEEDEE
jgi:DNA gyrase subunit A